MHACIVCRLQLTVLWLLLLCTEMLPVIGAVSDICINHWLVHVCVFTLAANSLSESGRVQLVSLVAMFPVLWSWGLNKNSSLSVSY